VLPLCYYGLGKTLSDLLVSGLERYSKSFAPEFPLDVYGDVENCIPTETALLDMTGHRLLYTPHPYPTILEKIS
jgi:hypothetical protein